MDAVTYPNEEVADYINQYFVPVQIDIKQDPGAMERLQAMWTPTIIFRDDRGHEYRRSTGFLSPQEMLAELSMARLAATLVKGNHDAAVEIAAEVERRSKFDANRHAEARYWAGVAAYKQTNDGAKLAEYWKPLIAEAPESEWAKKASFINKK